MPGTAISARSTTTGRGCAARSRKGWWTSPTRSRWACAARSTTPSDWTGLRDELGLDYLTTEDVFALGPEAVAQRIRERVDDRPAFISFDIDVVDPAYAPGTGTPEAGGPSARDMLAVVRGLTGIDFVGFDVVEVIPAYDPAGQTATLAANLAYEMLSLVALQRRAAADGMDGSYACLEEPDARRASAGPPAYRAAAVFTFDMDAESAILFEHPESADWLDVMSHQAYGPRTGVRAHPAHPGPAAGACHVLCARLHRRALAGHGARGTRRRPRDRPPRLPARGRALGAGRGDRGATAAARPGGAGHGPWRAPGRAIAPRCGSSPTDCPRCSPATASCTTPG